MLTCCGARALRPQALATVLTFTLQMHSSKLEDCIQFESLNLVERSNFSKKLESWKWTDVSPSTLAKIKT